jgi:hypothetical protein
MDMTRVNIDHLVLDGLSAETQAQVVHALRSELARLVAAAPPTRDWHAARWSTDVQARAGEPPAMLGARIARTLHGSLGGPAK